MVATHVVRRLGLVLGSADRISTAAASFGSATKRFSATPSSPGVLSACAAADCSVISFHWVGKR